MQILIQNGVHYKNLATILNCFKHIMTFKTLQKGDLPSYFDAKSLETAKRKYPALAIRNKLFFCTICCNSKIETTKSSPWASTGVFASKEDRTIENLNRELYKSILKKIDKHFTSKMHMQEEKNAEFAKDDPLRKCVEKLSN